MNQAGSKQHWDADPDRLVRYWLYLLCAMVFAMVMVGGATRLTDSGLSITEWKPLLGIIPPLNEADWQEAFAKYRQIPEYRILNSGMSLDEFRFIYWWEWTHRFLGRFIGLVFLIPFLFFWATGRLGKGLMPKLLAMFVLGGLQGALGWYMVTSGLVDRLDVSQYRLAAHLCAAVFIFGYILWVALGLRPPRPHAASSAPGLVVSAAGLTVLVFVQIGLGGFVAGLDAGQGYNTWPLMDGRLVPKGLGAMSPWYLNLFENALTVQFNHRMTAYLLLVWVILHCALIYRTADDGNALVVSALLMATMFAQAILGISTLLAKAPLGLSLVHQTGAIIVFALAVYQLHALLRARQSAESA